MSSVTKGHIYLNKPATRSYSFVQACTTPPTPPDTKWLSQIKNPMDIYLLKVNNRNNGNKMRIRPRLTTEIPDRRYDVILVSSLPASSKPHTMLERPHR